MELASMVLAGHEHWEGHAGEWWPLIPILWVVVIFGFIYLLRRAGCGRRHHRSSGESMLGERFARGEIDEREYRERLDVLRNGRNERR